MNTSKRYLGIDLGGCMSGTTAFCLIEGTSENYHIVNLEMEPKHKDYLACHTFLREKILSFNACVIGLDAPMSLPQKLLNPNFEPKPRPKAKGEIANPYLYRYCDYYFFEQFGLRPMPPAGDRIGRLTARAMQLLHDSAMKDSSIIEIYPKQIAYALGFHDYKKQLQALLNFFTLDSTVNIHQVDAVLAAYGTMLIDEGHTHTIEDKEGWAYPLIFNV